MITHAQGRVAVVRKPFLQLTQKRINPSKDKFLQILAFSLVGKICLNQVQYGSDEKQTSLTKVLNIRLQAACCLPFLHHQSSRSF